MKIENHPCFSNTCGKFARIHLPIAPKCNIQCNYCRRDFDCANESRPGVTSKVLNQQEAAELYYRVAAKMDNLTIVGIAGPGDALANFQEVYETIKLIKQLQSGVEFCISTNGLYLLEYLPELIKLNVRYLTVTINAIDVVIGAQIYQYIEWKEKRIFGKEAFSLLSLNQMAGLEQAIKRGICCKVNTIVLPGINEGHIVDIAQKLNYIGCYLHNIIPMIGVAGTPFAQIKPCSSQQLATIRTEAGRYIKQMGHCERCRADAIGSLKNDCHTEFY